MIFIFTTLHLYICNLYICTYTYTEPSGETLRSVVNSDFDYFKCIYIVHEQIVEYWQRKYYKKMNRLLRTQYQNNLIFQCQAEMVNQKMVSVQLQLWRINRLIYQKGDKNKTWKYLNLIFPKNISFTHLANWDWRNLYWNPTTTIYNF